MPFWKRETGPSGDDLIEALRDLPVVRKELDAREARRAADWEAQKAKHRNAIVKLEAGNETAEKREDADIAATLKEFGAVQARLGRLNYEREDRRGRYRREVLTHQAALRALGAPALERTAAEVERRIAYTQQLRIGWQDRAARDAHLAALVAMRDELEAGVVRGGDETDKEFVARLWSNVPPCPPPSSDAPPPEPDRAAQLRHLAAERQAWANNMNNLTRS